MRANYRIPPPLLELCGCVWVSGCVRVCLWVGDCMQQLQMSICAYFRLNQYPSDCVQCSVFLGCRPEEGAAVERGRAAREGMGEDGGPGGWMGTRAAGEHAAGQDR